MSSGAAAGGKPSAPCRGPSASPPSSFAPGGDRAGAEGACEREAPARAAGAAGGGEERGASEAGRCALCLAPGAAAATAAAEMKEAEECIEEMLIKLDEFCSLTDTIRTDTSQLLDEVIPFINAKVIEMNNIYTKVDKLEAFVKMVAYHVSFLEEQVIQAEKAHATFPCTVQKLLGSIAIPSFKKKCSSPHRAYKLPELYRTEDYFNNKYIGSKYQNC